MRGFGARFFVFLNPSKILGFIIYLEFGGMGGGFTAPPPGISGSTYALKLKLTPGMVRDNRK